MIEVSHIAKDYGARRAVDDLSFTLEKGTIYGFLGPNGAGKTTTMNIMTGYLAASGGTVTVNGHDILKEAEEAKRHIGYLPEIPPVYGDMTVGEYLSFVAELKRVPKTERRDRIAKTLQMTMLGGYDGRMIRNLSKGYRQRVGLAQALVNDPEIIILDEPTVGLDPQQIIEIRNLIRSLKENHTVVLSSHILSEVSEVCDEILIISQGKLVAQGTPAELEKTYSGEAKLHLTVICPEPAVRNLLENMAGYNAIVFSDTEVDDRCSCTLTVDTGKADLLTEDVSRRLAEARIPVLAMHREQQTLEDVFLSVTQATPGVTPHPSAAPTPSPQGEGSDAANDTPPQGEGIEGADHVPPQMDGPEGGDAQ